MTLRQKFGSVNREPLSEAIANCTNRPTAAAVVLPALASPSAEEAGLFSRLGGDAIAVILSYASVQSLGALACVSKWFYAAATSDVFWLRAALSANLDWTMYTTAPQIGSRALHKQFGPRLMTWERNRTIELIVCPPHSAFAFDSASEHEEQRAAAIRFEPASLRGECMARWDRACRDQEPDLCSWSRRTYRVQIDQRTPLSTVIDPVIRFHYHDEPEDRRYGEEDYIPELNVHVGKPTDGSFGDRSHDAARTVDTQLTAWHYLLEEGDFVYLEMHSGLAD